MPRHSSAGSEGIAIIRVADPFESRVPLDLPRTTQLYQNYPNPFNPSSEITYGIPNSSKVNLKIFDIVGRVVVTLVNERKEVGMHTVTWDAEGVPSGIYFYRIVAGDFTDAKKMVLMK